MRALVVGEPSHYWDLVSPLPEGVIVTKTGTIDFVHVFVKDQKSFQREFLSLKKKLSKAGMMWVSWPKKASGVATDLAENIIRDFGLTNGLVDVKVCAVDEVWSGLKFVYRLADR